MFCSNCGKRIEGASKFCTNCGCQIHKNEYNINIPAETRLVSAKCTSCGATVNVHPKNETAICPYCGNTYIIEKTINTFNASNGNFNVENATINVIVSSADGILPQKRDELFENAGSLIIEKNKVSTALLQRTFKIGYDRANRIIKDLCNAGVISKENGTEPRVVLMNQQQFSNYLRDCK